jgi:DNA adenine methylase
MISSPLRYPGGKSNITPLIRLIIEKKNNDVIGGLTYIEPFAGGAGVAIDLLLEGIVSTVVINDYDKSIYSFWRALKHETDALIDLIEKTPVNIDEWHRQKNIYLKTNYKYSLELGFAAFFLNRTNRSGILKAGPIGGYDQKGTYLLTARYNKNTLINRIQKIALHKKALFIYNKEIRSFISQVISKYSGNTLIYFDPPYYAHGKRLYKNFLTHNDHIEIADYIKHHVPCDWVLTYDDAPEIRNIYSIYHYTCRKYTLNYSAANKGKGVELIFFKSPELLPTGDGIDSKVKQLSLRSW